VIGLNRSGVPTMRLVPHGRTAAGPLGAMGWCVVATVEGDLVWGNRRGRRKRLSLGGAVRELRTTMDGGLWTLSETSLVAFSAQWFESFRRGRVLAMTTASPSLRKQGFHGAVLTADQRLEWLDDAGSSVRVVPFMNSVADNREQLFMSLDNDGSVWLSAEPGQLQVVSPTGITYGISVAAKGELLEPVADAERRRTIIGTVTGEVLSLVWPGTNTEMVGPK